MPRRTSRTLGALFAGAILLTACGDDDHAGGDDHTDDAAPAAEGARRIEVTASDFAFEPGDITAEAGEDLAIALTSEDILHDLNIDDLDFHVDAGRGETAEGGLTVDEPGTYTFYCSVAGHRSAGMEGTLTVE